MALVSAKQFVLGAILGGTLLATGCSVQQLAARAVGDAMAEGSSVFESDDDLVLVGDALPFSLKLLEMLLAESPDDAGLLLSACRGFVTYAYVYVEPEAEQLAYADFARARAARERAQRLYRRASGYCMRALAGVLDGDPALLATAPAELLAAARQRDVPLLYWSAAALGLLVGVSRDDAALLARLPEVKALLGRALELEESWDAGALHEFSIVLAAAAPRPASADELARHYERALELSQGHRAGLFVAYAQALAIPSQRPELFRELLERALAVDPDAEPSRRLANQVARQRARWLLDHQDEFFVPDAGASS